MSFLGGPECSTAGNPLSQFTKHTQDDRSLQRDRLVGRGPSGMQEGMRSHMGGGSGDAMMEEFMHPAQLPQGPTASPFAMEQMRRDLEQASNTPQPWTGEFDNGFHESRQFDAAFQRPTNGGFSTADFQRFQSNHTTQTSTARTSSPLNGSQGTVNGYRPHMSMGMGYGGANAMGMGMGMGMGMMQQPFRPTSAPQTPVQQDSLGKGKQRMVELDDQDWEAQFASLDTQGQVTPDAEANAAMETELSALDRSVQHTDSAIQEHLSPLDQEEMNGIGTETDHFGDFESIWKGIQAETAAARELINEGEYGNHMGEFDNWGDFDGKFDGLNTHSSFGNPELGVYLFEEENFFKDIVNPFDEGVKIMAEGGNLSLAALAFEAAVQRDPQHVEAWVRLGNAQAQNEKETPAIRALEQALKIDPNDLDALMSLAVSYTNEGYDSTAYRTLERWVATKYPTLISEPLATDADVGFTDRHALQEKVTDLFIRAAQMSPSGEQMDPDVQVGLGVLFYGAEEYDKAVDCFGAALASAETGSQKKGGEEHLLWNRLGATLANSGRSEEAIESYERALALRPNFVRARYNLGVSCINIGCYEEAAQHLLGALSMHQMAERDGREKAKEIVGGGVNDAELERMMHQNQSTNLYDTLRRVFSQMGRRDLSERVGSGMDVESFRGQFEF
ncbi:Peroxisomal membrane signal receptor PTS1 [Elasticomyces elasticus]|nr:Peroxisomal membrane signal receptor PTS1 [Elasticomyces elasticus]